MAWWKRLIIIAITVFAVASIWQKIDPQAFLATLRRMRPEWVAAAVTLYGIVIVCAVGRWHLALRLADSAVHLAATVRSVLIGHFFTIAFFGVGFGDLVKSILYARWYRFSFPVVLAAAKIDRFMGTIGLLALGVLVFSWGMASDAFSEEAGFEMTMPSPGKWLLIGAAFATAILLLATNRTFRTGLMTFWTTFIAGVKRLVLWPRTGVPGVFFGFVVQGGLSFVLALNLQAVTDQSLEWGKLLWVFPVIQVISTLPVTVAGLGLREGTAIALLGIYGVSAEEAAAAALMTLVVAIFWAVFGGMALWRENHRLDAIEKPALPETITAVLPVLNEEAELPETISRLKAIPQIKEIVVADGGSSDQSRHIAEELGCVVLLSDKGRGRQLNAGVATATGDVILMVHADTWLEPHAGIALLNCLRDPLVVGGGFWKKFRAYPNPLLLGSIWRCGWRLWISRWIAGDQCIFVRREVLQRIGGIPEVPLMEEFPLCDRLQQEGRLALAADVVTTSIRRFQKFGVLKTYRIMNKVLSLYRCGAGPEQLAKVYEQEAEREAHQ